MGKVFRHRKGKYYYVLGISTHTETENSLVNYVRIDNVCNTIWSRPLSMWEEKVNGKPRFIHVPFSVIPNGELLCLKGILKGMIVNNHNYMYKK